MTLSITVSVSYMEDISVLLPLKPITVKRE